MSIKEIKSCEVCGSGQLLPLFSIGDQPLCDDLIPIGSKRTSIKYPTELVGCEYCTTVHQKVQIKKELLFPGAYHYRARFTRDVLKGMEDLVTGVQKRYGDISNKVVLDIGCNDSSLLKLFKNAGAKKICGIEPTDAIRDGIDLLDWGYQGYFDEKSVESFLEENRAPDIITFTNVFAHIDDLDSLLVNLRPLLHPKTKIIIENHYLGSVFAEKQFDTFYHEHPRTYSYNSFKVIADRLGLGVEGVEFTRRYNGNIRVYLGSASPSRSSHDIDESIFLEEISGWDSMILKGGVLVRRKLESLTKNGRIPLRAKAFPGRASVLINAFKIDSSLIGSTYENSRSPKVGHYVPGTRIQIRDESEFFSDFKGSDAIVNLAWHIHDEIEHHMRDRGFKGNVFRLWPPDKVI